MSADVAADLRGRGYEPVVTNGRTLYCRMESVTGSAFTQRVCLSTDQIAAFDQGAADTVDLMQRPHGIDCSGRQGKCERIK